MSPHRIHGPCLLSLIVAVSLARGIAPAARAGGPAAIPEPDPGPAGSLDPIVERWARSVGGWDGLTRLGGLHLESRGRIDGLAAATETWITRDGFRAVVTQGRDRSERVRQGDSCWRCDWNGKTQALDGRDRAAAVTEAFVRSLLYAGFDRASLAAARAHDLGRDSTGAMRGLRLEPPGGLPCTLWLDDASGRPARLSRRPYDEELVTSFGDWREVQGVAVPFRVVETGARGPGDTSIVTRVAALASRAARSFRRPGDGRPDVRFAAGGAPGIPFNFENEHIMVACRVNGSRPIWFLFDTGANATIVNRTRLAELGLVSFGAGTTSGGGGSTGSASTYVARLEVGRVTLLDQRDGVVDLSGLEKLYGMPMGGILGYDFASRFTIVVDYVARTMSLYPPSAAASLARGTRVPFVLEQNHPHVRGEIVVDEGDPIPADLVIDSGAAETANLTAPFVREHRLVERARTTPPAAPSVTPGERQFFTQTSVRGRLREIRLGEVRVTGIPVNLQQGTSGAYASASFAGTIGERLLQRFTTTYDYARSAIFLEPNAEAAKPFEPRTTFGVSLVSDGSDYTRFTVAGVRAPSPADSAGFRRGDVIAALDGRPAAAWRLAGVRAALAEAGSRHVARMTRAGQPDTILEFTVRLVSIEDR